MSWHWLTTGPDDDDALNVFDVRLRVRCEEGLLYGGSLYKQKAYLQLFFSVDI